MSKTGPKKTPTQILKMRGSWLADKRGDEPAGEVGVPVCPAWLQGVARRKWTELTKQLDMMGVLTTVDRNALARYCKVWAMWRDAVSFLDDKGTVYTLKDNEGKAKYLQQFPQVGIMNNLASQLSKLEDSFGMTPSARAGLVVDKKKKDSGKSRFFNKVG